MWMQLHMSYPCKLVDASQVAEVRSLALLPVISTCHMHTFHITSCHTTGPIPTFRGTPSLVNLSANFLMGAVPEALRNSAACGKVVDLSNNLLSVSSLLCGHQGIQ
jgi:hypothetical protein